MDVDRVGDAAEHVAQRIRAAFGLVGMGVSVEYEPVKGGVVARLVVWDDEGVQSAARIIVRAGETRLEAMNALAEAARAVVLAKVAALSDAIAALRLGL
jgi:hypothetical protein